MQQSLIRILYVSTARPNIKEADVEAIVNQSAKANARTGITGALAFNGVRFCQCLEGYDRDVGLLLSRITEDTRHVDVTLIAKVQVDSRYFAGWAMQWIFDHSFQELRDALEAHPLPKFC